MLAANALRPEKNSKTSKSPLSAVITSQSNKQLSRIVFDSLFEKNLLGGLLSSHHFKKHLSWLEHGADLFTSFRISAIINNKYTLNEFHRTTLTMYAGINIDECKHASHNSFMVDLDEKLRIALGDETTNEPSVLEQNNVELAWKYRNACNPDGQNLLTPF